MAPTHNGIMKAVPLTRRIIVRDSHQLMRIMKTHASKIIYKNLKP